MAHVNDEEEGRAVGRPESSEAPTPTLTPTPTPTPTPTLTDDDLCVECSDNETPWMENNGRDCASSDWLLSRKCNQNNFWTKKSFCQKSCYDKGLGYEGVICCSGESESSGSAFCWKFGSSCSDSSQCCSGECMGNRRCA